MKEKEMLTITVNLDQEIADKINKLTKEQLREKYMVAAIEAHIATKKLLGLEEENEILRTKLHKAEAYVEQGRSMISAVMERWHEYDA